MAGQQQLSVRLANQPNGLETAVMHPFRRTQASRSPCEPVVMLSREPQWHLCPNCGMPVFGMPSTFSVESGVLSLHHDLRLFFSAIVPYNGMSGPATDTATLHPTWPLLGPKTPYTHRQEACALYNILILTLDIDSTMITDHDAQRSIASTSDS